MINMKGTLVSVDFQENTVTFKIDGDFSVKAGEYLISSVDNEDEENSAFLDARIYAYRPELSPRIINALHCKDIETFRELLEFGKWDVLKFRNFGKKSFLELKAFLKSNGVEWPVKWS